MAKAGYICGYPALDETINIYLERKGYEYLQENLFEKALQYKYMASRSRRLFGGPHYVLNLQYVWDYINIEENWNDIRNTEIFADIDINNCSLKFPYKTGRIEVRPDVLIKVREDGVNKKLVLVENDIGTENTIQVFRKFLRYSFYLEKIERMHVLARDYFYPKVELYFICLSEERLNNLFVKGTLSNYFRFTNSFMGKYHIHTKDMIRVFQQKFFNFYIKSYKKGNFKEHNLTDTIRLNPLFKNVY